MNQYTFLVTSAMNTKFGVFDSAQRLTQTLATIDSIRQRVPTAKIYLLEMAGLPLQDHQREQLLSCVDHVMDFTTDPAVIDLYQSTDNWDIVKNVTEIMCFGNALKRLHTDTDQFRDSQRIFKLSGRYLLNDDFKIDYYDQYSTQSHIVVSKSRSSQFPLHYTQVERQFMSRLWSWPAALTDEIIAVYDQGLNFIQERILAGGYVDIEHVLYRFLDHNKLIELDAVGVQGNIGPNGTAVRD
jgi:hypothetical protein